MCEWTDIETNRHIVGWIHRWMDGQTERQTDDESSGSKELPKQFGVPIMNCTIIDLKLAYNAWK